MKHAADTIYNEQQTDYVDIKRCDGGALSTAQRDIGENRGDDQVGAMREFSMT